MKKILVSSLCVATMTCSFTSVYGAELTAVDAELLGPSAISVDQDGTIYVVDEKNNNIVKITDDSSEIIAGYTLPGDYYGIPSGNYYDSTAQNSLFNKPSDMIFWNDGYVISDTGNHCLRFVKNGEVTTIAGTNEAGNQTGTVENARFYLPKGLAVDDNGVLYVADSGNGSIKTVSSSGVVANYVTGLNAPCGLYFYEDVLYVTDMGTHEIYTVQSGEVALLSGNSELDEDEWLGGYIDGDISVAEFCNPQGIFVDYSGIYVADTGNAAVRKIANNTVSTIFSAEDGDGIWPTAPTDVVILNGTAYIADPFAGVVISQSLVGYGFTDLVEGSWWIDSAKNMIYLGLMNGVTDESFAPEEIVTREMAVTILYRYNTNIIGETEINSTNDFVDVADDMWYSDAVSWAVSCGIITGHSDTEFGLSEAVSRQDLVTMIYRYANYLAMNVETNGDLTAFYDGQEVADYAGEAMSWAIGEEIVNGVSAESIEPSGYTTRDQMAVIFNRFMDM
ncbi:MAG: S-layer homology domain-containing protein [Clostridia bacterium]